MLATQVVTNLMCSKPSLLINDSRPSHVIDSSVVSTAGAQERECWLGNPGTTNHITGSVNSDLSLCMEQVDQITIQGR